MGEFGPLLERRAATTDHLGLLDADRRQCLADRRKGTFPHAEDADLFRFNERDRDPAGQIGAKPLGEIPRGQPTGGPAADDNHPLHHVLSARSFRPPGYPTRRPKATHQNARLIPVLMRRSVWNQLRPYSLSPGYPPIKVRCIELSRLVPWIEKEKFSVTLNLAPASNWP